jgi:hypothetical protein
MSRNSIVREPKTEYQISEGPIREIRPEQSMKRMGEKDRGR